MEIGVPHRGAAFLLLTAPRVPSSASFPKRWHRVVLTPEVDDGCERVSQLVAEPPGPPAREEAELLVLTTAQSGTPHQTGPTEADIAI
jgi:hypothetical protein